MTDLAYPPIREEEEFIYAYPDDSGCCDIYDVTAAWRLIRKDRPVGEMDVRNYTDWLAHSGWGDEAEIIMAANPDIPVLAVPRPEVWGGWLVIDGNHRIARCRLEYIPTIACYYLTEEEAKSLIVEEAFPRLLAEWW